jgi:transcriptional regulator with XRE-family HTH domain
VETRDPTDIDKLVSESILARRNELGMSQPELAERVGVTFQQVQKYENG